MIDSSRSSRSLGLGQQWVGRGLFGLLGLLPSGACQAPTGCWEELTSDELCVRLEGAGSAEVEPDAEGSVALYCAAAAGECDPGSVRWYNGADVHAALGCSRGCEMSLGADWPTSWYGEECWESSAYASCEGLPRY